MPLEFILLFVFFAFFVLHELGHYFVAGCFGLKPKIKLTWFGGQCDLNVFPLSWQKYCLTCFAGFAITVPLGIFSSLYFLIATIFSLADFLMIFIVLLEAKRNPFFVLTKNSRFYFDWGCKEFPERIINAKGLNR